MLVSIEFNDEFAYIEFNGRDFTTRDELVGIASSIAAGRFCFEAAGLLSPEFEQFIESLEPEKRYAITISNIHNPLLEWGLSEAPCFLDDGEFLEPPLLITRARR